MATAPETHISNERFAEYITELHEFSRSHHVPYGRPGDLAGLLSGLHSSTTFSSEFGSMMRSIVLREQFRASEFELFSVVAAAWGDLPKDHLSKRLSPPMEELRGIVHNLLQHETIGAPPPIEPPAVRSGDGNQRSVSSIAEGQELKRISALRGFSSLKPLAAPLAEEPPNTAPATVKIHSYPAKTHAVPEKRQPDLNAGEIIAAGLIGVVVALLLSVGSLPVYRAQVSAELPATAAPGDSQPKINDGSPAYAIASGQLTGQVAELLLARPHPAPILRQDALSRGMRDLSLGGKETILFADLVAKTARQVKVRRLNSTQVYEITCDSWSAQFAATFCNELLGALDQGPGTVRIVDMAVGPGVQIYPHWYLQSFAGLLAGCLIGALAGLIKQAKPEANLAEDASEQ